MLTKLGVALAWLLVGVAVVLALASGKAFAGMIATDEAAASAARERVVALAQRPETARQLLDYGLVADQARERVDAMSDAEVLALAGKLDALPAGGEVTNEGLIITVLIVAILVLLL